MTCKSSRCNSNNRLDYVIVHCSLHIAQSFCLLLVACCKILGSQIRGRTIRSNSSTSLSNRKVKMQRRAVASSLNSDLPLGGSHVTSYGKGSMTNKKSSNGILSIVFVILLLGTSAMLITEKNKSKDLQDRLFLLQDEHDQVSKQSASKSAELSRVKAEKEKLARENTSVTEKAADHKGKLEDTEKSQQEVIKRLNALQSEVQRHSKHDVLEQ